MTLAAPTDPRPPRVVVAGAGYAGVRAATAARRAGADVVLVDGTGNHEFGPRLAAVAGGRAPSGDGWAPADDLTGLPVERAVVTAVDGAGPAVQLEDGRVLTADAVVVATGATSRFPAVAGAEQFAQGLRTVADALTVRRELIEVDRLVVVGGGTTGVQLAGEAAHRHRHLDVTLLEADERLLPAMPSRVGRRVEHLLRRRGVDVRRRARVEQVTSDGVVLADGTAVSGFVVWATGFAVDATRLLPGAETDGGRVVVDQMLRVPGTYGVLAAGDLAAHRDVFGQPLQMSAQVAVRAGGAAGRNAARLAQGLPPSPALLYDLGRLVPLGRHVGVGTVGPVRLAGPLIDRMVPLLHEAVDVQHLYRTGGVGAVLRHHRGRHRPAPADTRRVERPQVRSVG